MKYLFLFAASLFDVDPITTGGVGGATANPTATPTTPAAGSCGDLCRDPGNGMPHYVKAVLDGLLANGILSRTTYTSVCSGTKSIEDLLIPSEVLARLRCDGTGEESAYDIHFDPHYPPALSAVPASLQAAFQGGHRPTDKVHRLAFSSGAQASVAGSIVGRITFGTPYYDSNGQAVAPNVVVTGAGGTATWRAANVSPYGYDLATDSGIAANTSGTIVQIVVEPARS